MWKNRTSPLLIFLTALLLTACSAPPPEQTQPASLPETQTASPPPASTASSTITPVPLTATQEPSPSITPTQVTPIPEDLLFSIGDPYAGELGSRAIDVLAYDLTLHVAPGDSNFIEGEASLTIQALYTPLDVFALDFAGFEVLDVSIDGIGLDFSRENKKLIIETALPYMEGEVFTVTIQYAGWPKEDISRFVPFVSHLGLFFPNANNVFVLSEPDGSHYWFPCNDHPRDKAIFSISLIIPDNLIAISNGNLIENKDLNDGTRQFTWKHDFPMAPYLAAFAIGDYQEVINESPSGFMLKSYIFDDTIGGFKTEMEDMAEAIDWLSELLIPYPYDSFGYVIVDGFGASLETQSMVILDETMISEFVMVHEMIHMWFGDWVSLDSWGEMWRNEGVTNYFSMLWLYRDQPESLMNYFRSYEEEALAKPGVEPLSDLSPGNLFGDEAYNFGMLVVHKLRMEIGDEAFFNGFRIYLDLYGGNTASDEDFIRVMETASGQDLTEFFDYWLNYSTTYFRR